MNKADEPENLEIDLVEERAKRSHHLFRDALNRDIQTIEHRHVRDRTRFALSQSVTLRDGDQIKHLKGPNP